MITITAYFFEESDNTGARLTLTHIGFRPSSALKAYINKYIDKLQRRLLCYQNDLPDVIVILRRDRDGQFLTFANLSLSMKSMIATGLGYTPQEAIREAFQKLFREYETYKGKHFKGSSKYWNHETLRGHF